MRGIIGELELGDGITVVDMEAGLELFGRGTPGPSDLVVTVIEPSLWSIQTSIRVVQLAKELGVPRVVAVANKIRDDVDVEWIREALQPHGIDLIAVVPYDAAVNLADRKMSALLDIAPDSKAVRSIATVADCIEAIGGRAKEPVPASGDGQGVSGKPGEQGCPWVVDKY